MISARPVILALSLGVVILSGCNTAVQRHIRERDFRNIRRMERYNVPPPADAAGLPGWTTNMSHAAVYANRNNFRTAVFFYRNGEAVSDRVKSALRSSEGRTAASRVVAVAIDVDASPQVAARFKVKETPALLLIDPSGKTLASHAGPMTKSQAVNILQQ
ncbi:MAG: thioredoxin family protein [bacterium]|nr:thioredoxin family protein [Candidatus Sumerlaeota bacterium]